MFEGQLCPSPFLWMLFEPHNKIPREIKSAALLKLNVQLPLKQS